jgi:hypothetical protein
VFSEAKKEPMARFHGLDRATYLRDDAAVLLQVSLVYVNTLMIQQVLAEPEWRDRLTAHTGPSTLPANKTRSLRFHSGVSGCFRQKLANR